MPVPSGSTVYLHPGITQHILERGLRQLMSDYSLKGHKSLIPAVGTAGRFLVAYYFPPTEKSFLHIYYYYQLEDKGSASWLKSQTFCVTEQHPLKRKRARLV